MKIRSVATVKTQQKLVIRKPGASTKSPAVARRAGAAVRPMSAVVLAGYALVACALAIAFPLRRDVT